MGVYHRLHLALHLNKTLASVLKMYIVTSFFPSSYTLEKVQNAVTVFYPSSFFLSFFLPSLLRPGIEEEAGE
jgi:hypothetical protein